MADTRAPRNGPVEPQLRLWQDRDSFDFMGIRVPVQLRDPARESITDVLLSKRQWVMEEYQRLGRPERLPSEVEQFGRIYDDAMEQWRVEQEEQARWLEAVNPIRFWPRNYFADIQHPDRLGFFPDGATVALESTAEGHQQFEQAQREREEHEKKLKEAHLQAEKRAVELLKATLPEEIYRRYKKTGIVEVRTDRWHYAIHENTQTHIFKDGVLQCTACFQLKVQAPAKDRMVAEYLMIKGDEMRYLMTANITWADQPTTNNETMFQWWRRNLVYNGFGGARF